MVLFNYATKELTAKVVYYGPGLCGKTTNLQFVHQNLPETVKGKMLSLATKTDRTLFFDFLPLDLGEIRGMKTRVQLYTVPGQVFYNETRKLVLKGVDGVVFVADSQQEMIGPNLESFKNLEENLKGHGVSLAELPHVIQFNKRDLPKLAGIDEINTALNKYNAPFYESVATTGIGVKDTLNAITKLVLLHLTKKYGTGAAAAKPAAVSKPAKTPPVAVSTPEEEVPVAASVAAEPEPVAVSAAAMAPAATLSTEASAPGGTEVTMGPGDDLPPEPPSAGFGHGEIDDLMDEVQSAGAGEADLAPEPPPGIDTPAPDGVAETPAEAPWEAPPEAPIPTETEITLTEAATDDDLFDAPDLEVARLACGQARELVIPVEVGDETSGLRRYKLSLKLRLDSVD